MFGFPLDRDWDGENTPFQFKEGRVDPLVVDEMKTLFQGKLEPIGFYKADDFRNDNGHFAYEGHFHADPKFRGKEKMSMHPKYGHDYRKPPADPFLVNFVLAFKRKNKPFLDRLKRELEGPLLKLVNNMFEDISVQIHWGRKVDPLVDLSKWHRDAVNSAVHLALGVHGSRALHLNYHDTATATHVQTKRVPLDKGSFYISSPFVFNHAVEYGECDWDNRIIAIQFRTLIMAKDHVDSADKELYIADMRIINDAIRDHRFEMPTMGEIKRKSWFLF